MNPKYHPEDSIPPPTIASSDPDDSTPRLRTSRFHFLLPASQSNVQLCYSLASAAVNRYPVPTLLGWNGTGDFDAAVTHLAKVRSIERYLHSLGDEENGDLVLIVDGYDTLQQLPAEVMVERYFEVARKANSELARQLGISQEDALAGNVKQTVFFGADKLCWPPDNRAARCWAAPASSLTPGAFGPDRGPHEFFSADPRWLNSGTLMGPVGDVKRVVNATAHEIGATFDADFWQSNSDQYYISNVWGRQEYWRLKQRYGQDNEAPGGPPDRLVPDRRADVEDTELHMAVEYESSLFQTKAGNEPFLNYFQYNSESDSANVTIDALGRGLAFKPYGIGMPRNVKMAVMKLFDSIPEAHQGVSAENWLRTAHFGTNFITKHIYSLWHCTGPKEFMDGEFTRFWFYPFVKSLLRASVKASQSNEAIASRPIDGRTWVPKLSYPPKEQMKDEYGGAWSDGATNRFITWKELCGQHEEAIFWGQNALGL